MGMKAKICDFSLSAGLLCLSLPALALRGEMTDFKPERLEIVWESSPFALPSEQGNLKAYHTQWLESCRNLGKALLVGSGPFATGVFSQFSCWKDGMLMEGDAIQSTWRLEFSKTDEEQMLVLKRRIDSVWIVENTIPLTKSEWTLTFLADPELADVISLKITDALPFAGYIKKSTLTGQSITGRRLEQGMQETTRSTGIKPYPKIMLYGLKSVAGGEMWAPTLYKLGELEKKSDPKQKNVTWKLEDLSPPVTEVPADVWFHHEKGPGTKQEEYQEQIENILKRLESEDMHLFSGLADSIFQSAAAGYVGIRYGKQLLPGESELIKNTSFIGLLLEIRSGPVRGLRYYYDTVPETTANQEGKDTKISWSRHVIGASLSREVNWPIIDRVDLTPKLGIWSFDTITAVGRDTASGSIVTGDFSISNQPSIAIEVGVECESPNYILRPWYAFDQAYKLGSVKTEGITSTRLGTDLFFTAGPQMQVMKAKIKTGILAFGMVEYIKISKEKKETLGPGEVDFSGVTYRAGYLGGGLALSW